MTGKVIEKCRRKLRSMKKEDYIVLLLFGVLLLIVSLPTDRGSGGKENAAGFGGGGGQEEGADTGVFRDDKDAGGEQIIRSAGNAEEKGSTGSAVLETGNFGSEKNSDLDVYVGNLEKRVEEMLSGMEGAGKVQVMITVSDTGMEILERNSETTAADLEETDDAGGRRKNVESGQSEEVVYLRDADGNEIPYVVQRKLPEVTGVVVMAEGAGDARVKENIIGAVGVLFNLNEHRIKVIRMKS